jgi:ABC-type lipoprotein export system ATPase subunit
LLIQLRNVEKSYPLAGGRVYVLRRIDLDVPAGDFVSIMGPSGAGKSTLLHILGMHDGEFSGDYVLDGQPVHKLGRKERLELQKRTIGFVSCSRATTCSTTSRWPRTWTCRSPTAT